MFFFYFLFLELASIGYSHYRCSKWS